jgi:hypothetical protein
MSSSFQMFWKNHVIYVNMVNLKIPVKYKYFLNNYAGSILLNLLELTVIPLSSVYVIFKVYL